MKDNKNVYFELYDKESRQIASGKIWNLKLARKFIKENDCLIILRTDLRNLFNYRKEI